MSTTLDDLITLVGLTRGPDRSIDARLALLLWDDCKLSGNLEPGTVLRNGYGSGYYPVPSPKFTASLEDVERLARKNIPAFNTRHEEPLLALSDFLKELKTSRALSHS